MSRAWMPLYVADYLADTGHLSAAEHGAYLLLIMHYWQNGGLPKDPNRLARIARMTREEWDAAASAVGEFFDENWRHERIDRELLKASEASQKAKEKADKRWGNAAASAGASAGAKPGQSSSNANHNHNHSSKKNLPSVGSSRQNLDPDADLDEAARLWNETATRCRLSRVQRLTDQRKRALAARLKEAGGIAGWRAAMAKVEASAFLRGETSRWRATFDFVLQASSFVKLMEGAYDDGRPPPPDTDGYAALFMEGLDGYDPVHDPDTDLPVLEHAPGPPDERAGARGARVVDLPRARP